MRYAIIAIGLVLIAAGIYRFVSPEKEFPAPAVPPDAAVLLAPTCGGPAAACAPKEEKKVEPTSALPKPDPDIRFVGHDPRVRQALELLKEGRKEAAIELFEEMLKENPKNEYALSEYAILLSMDPKQRDKAAQLFERAIDANPENEFALEDLVRLKEEEGPGGSRETIDRLMKKYPDSSAVGMMHGRSLLRDGNPEEALPYLERAAKDPVLGESANRDLVEVYRQTGNARKAAEIQEKVIAADEVFYERHKTDKNNIPEYLSAEILKKKMDLARTLLIGKEFDKAQSLLDGLLKENPNRVDVQELREQLKRSRG